MKIWIVGSLLFLFAGLGEIYAQQTPVVNQRQQNQRARIRQGVKSGELTKVETKEAVKDQRHIRRAERRAKADGVVTGREKARLSRKQNQASRELRRNKNDAQSRPNN